MLRNEIPLIKKPEFPFLTAAKRGPDRNRNDSSYSYHSATVNKMRKADDFEFDTVQKKLRSTEHVKMEMNSNPAVIKEMNKKLLKRQHLYAGRLSQNITASKTGGVLCRTERRTTSYSPNFKVRNSIESLPMCI